MKANCLFSLIVFGLFSYVSHAQPPEGACYQGTLTLEDGVTRPVKLSLAAVFDGYFHIEEFRVGDYLHPYSGEVLGERLRFNSNDDYIPGGNASFNMDIELSFSGDRVEGTYGLYLYFDRDGYGGFGYAEGKVGDGAEVESGVLELELCE